MISHLPKHSFRPSNFIKALAGVIAAAIPVIAFVIAVAILPLQSAWAAGSTGRCSNSPLDILLTNDDGYDAAGIKALYQSLNAAGHRVTLVAPENNASGSSAALNFGKIQLKKVPAIARENFLDTSLSRQPSQARSHKQPLHSNHYAVSASPATSVVLAVTALYPENQPPDLLISGINKGANLGPSTPISGTVGATTAALTQLSQAIPAIAISTDPLGPDPYNPDPRISGAGSPENLQHLNNIAAFVASLVVELQQYRCATGRLMPTGIALNINYPPLAPSKIPGLLVTEQSKKAYYSISYRAIAEPENQPETKTKPGADKGTQTTVFAAAFKKLNVDASDLISDTGAYHAGYITVVPLTGNMSGNINTRTNENTDKPRASGIATKLQPNEEKPGSVFAQLNKLLAGVRISDNTASEH